MTIVTFTQEYIKSINNNNNNNLQFGGSYNKYKIKYLNLKKMLNNYKINKY